MNAYYYELIYLENNIRQIPPDPVQKTQHKTKEEI